jgi:biuret amidohydrolase
MERVNGLDVPQSLEDACDPRRLALVIYDMQVGIMGQIDDGAAIVERVREVLAAARGAGCVRSSSGT